MNWSRLVSMALALTAVLWMMREFNTTGPGRPPALVRWFGNPDAAIVDFCPTRVTKLELSNGVSFEQEGVTWYRVEQGARTELDQVGVEKWFGKYCMIEGQKGQPSADVSTVFKAHFVTGEPSELVRSNSKPQNFEWRGQSFSSPVLEAALQELLAISTHTRH